MARKCQEMVQDVHEMDQEGQEMAQDGQEMVRKCQVMSGNGPIQHFSAKCPVIILQLLTFEYISIQASC